MNPFLVEGRTGTVLYDAPLCRFKEIGTKNVLEREIHKAALTHSIDSDHKCESPNDH